ncbi:pore-forming ESAT-6 family protein [Nocardiopsis suaedae]|uniref:Pore-forming ESAT-6 family protein n=1 Tax=Nocardiopsis suaedae TaxID=3018444 RepID=A0ABT4TP23_9ACTN|nr:pore-forming ESAT-6 family protein [Nocardiopsis suaedae]MDA2805902.1 pore-forming ESAT-6 family protein [Nocardiopsis suaedae]
MSGNGRNSYDMGASQEAQGNIHTVMARLEQIIGDRDTDVSSAMADFEATGVSDEYSAKELKWHNAANEVRDIIRLVRTTLEENDGTAQTALGRASSAVQSI